MKGPEGLQPYIFHGLEVSHRSREKEALADCPLCGASKKFTIDAETGKWRCFVCGEKGNSYTFLRKLWDISSERNVDYSDLVKDRGLAEETLRSWGVVKSVLTDEWLVPGYNTKGEITQLYRYVDIGKEKKKLLATPTLHHQIHGVNEYDPNKQVVFLCEGPWDGMKLWEVLGSHKEKSGKYIRTKNSKQSLLAECNVLAVPGCSTFHDSWSSVFLGKKVFIVYDNDHPRKHPKTGKLITPAAYAGIQKVSSMIGQRASQIKYLRWGPKGYDRELPNNYDVRDFLEEEKNLSKFMLKLQDVPNEWLVSEKEKEQKKKEIKPKDCKSWKQLTDAWKERMEWGDGLDTSLAVMLSCAMSTRMESDPLWIRIIGPPSCGKSTLCEAISVSKQWVYAKDKMTSLVSGFKGKDDTNYSPIEKFAEKTIAIKDADTIMGAASKEEVLSQVRGLYDRNFRTEYANGMGKNYEDVYTSILLCGTPSLREMDSSELGARFLDCVVMYKVDSDHEDMVLENTAMAALRLMKGKKSGDKEGGTKGELEVLTMQLTAGYLDHLRTNYEALTDAVPDHTPKQFALINNAAKLVSYLRARPSKKQEETEGEREFSTRLRNQLMKLSVCLTVVMGKSKIDDLVLRRTIKVALDTCIGRSFDICNALYESENGVTQKYLCMVANMPTAKARSLLRFLKHLGAVEQFNEKRHGITGQSKWRLTEDAHKLFESVLEWRINEA